MASPVCTVNALAAPQNVTAGSTVTVALQAIAGVNQWTLQCTSTDETITAAAINASLAINNTTKTATFTAPAAGTAMLFTSVVNGGLTAGQSDPTQTTTFGVFVPAANGNRVGAVGMTYEPSATYGWTSIVNAAARASGGTGSSAIAGTTPAGTATAGQFFAATSTTASGFVTITADITASTSTPGSLQVTALTSAGAIPLTTAIALGSASAQTSNPVAMTGFLRGPNSGALFNIRNLQNSADMQVIMSDGGNDLFFGDPARTSATVMSAASGVYTNVGGAYVWKSYTDHLAAIQPILGESSAYGVHGYAAYGTPGAIPASVYANGTVELTVAGTYTLPAANGANIFFRNTSAGSVTVGGVTIATGKGALLSSPNSTTWFRKTPDT